MTSLDGEGGNVEIDMDVGNDNTDRDHGSDVVVAAVAVGDDVDQDHVHDYNNNIVVDAADHKNVVADGVAAVVDGLVVAAAVVVDAVAVVDDAAVVAAAKVEHHTGAAFADVAIVAGDGDSRVHTEVVFAGT